MPATVTPLAIRIAASGEGVTSIVGGGVSVGSSVGEAAEAFGVSDGAGEPLGEAEDDAFLNEGQRAEERLGSVDYEVLRCPSCQYQQMVTHNRWFSGYHDCPSCHCKTLKVESFVTEHATTMSTGRRRITRQCRHCAFADEREEIIPRRPEPSHSSSHSSGSSFGGGRSSGGGASGSW